MPHDTHVIDGFNKDIGLMSPEEAKEHYLSLCEGWTPYNPNPVVVEHEGVFVVRDDLTVGTKTRAGDLLMSKVKADTLVYCQPRVGLAGVSLCDVALRHPEKKIVLFMPSSKKISIHQACCIERGVTPIFERIAAMPNLNLYAKRWAAENGAYFIPLGLKHELATAAIVHAASTIEEPEEVYVAISTGVLSRALQIAWPNAKFTCVAVARNLKAGELGRANVISEPLEFAQSEKAENLPPFPSVATYDSKIWKYIPKNTGRRILMWNVGTDPILHDKSIIDRTDSYRAWKKNEKHAQ
jgi:hypothetical protein